MLTEYSSLYQFQFTPLREGRRSRSRHQNCSAHFNSRPSARGDLAFLQDVSMYTISIHAPPRGATIVQKGNLQNAHFNSRPSARGDVQKGNLQNAQFISIHAPPRGATIGMIMPSPYEVFQFTPLREGRHRQLVFCHAREHFNSRPSARGDDAIAPLPTQRGKFQFTPLREGRRTR